jgi:hypothetical protein
LVFSAVFLEQGDATSAQSGFEGAGRVVDAWMDHAAVVTGPLTSGGWLLLEDRDMSVRRQLMGLACSSCHNACAQDIHIVKPRHRLHLSSGTIQEVVDYAGRCLCVVQ